jgi:hypothetical protein
MAILQQTIHITEAQPRQDYQHHGARKFIKPSFGRNCTSTGNVPTYHIEIKTRFLHLLYVVHN